MSKFTIADIPKIQPGIPQTSAPPAGMMGVYGENPWDVAARDADEAGQGCPSDNLFEEASVPTVFHETFHGLRRGAHEAGTITPAMEIFLLMNHDKSLGDRRVREARFKSLDILAK